jgi:hypothetical protein
MPSKKDDSYFRKVNRKGFDAFASRSNGYEDFLRDDGPYCTRRNERFHSPS